MSRTATRVLIAALVAIALVLAVTWSAWVSIQPTRSGPKHATAATLAANNTDVRPMAVGDCIQFEKAYLQAHRERTDLHVDGKDCNLTRQMSVGGPPGSPAWTASLMSTCQGYWEDVYLNAWGFIQMGYIQIAIGACYDGSTVSRMWGPTCTISFWPPNMKGWRDYDGYYGSGFSRLTTYCQTQGELWLAPWGWCCDKYWYDQYTIDQTGNWWWS